MNIEQIRHGTHILHYHGITFLVDPVLADKGTLAPIDCAQNKFSNPLVPLPVPISHLTNVDAILITHCHSDHFDTMAKQLLPKHLPLFCQPCDAKNIRGFGFSDVRPVRGSIDFNHIHITRTGGHHGKGLIGKMMGSVSGFVFQATDEPTHYLMGDTIWCKTVADTLTSFTPDTCLCYAGAAKLIKGAPITMGIADLEAIHHHQKSIHMIVNHMDAWNHCTLSRHDLTAHLKLKNLTKSFSILKDGEALSFTLPSQR